MPAHPTSDELFDYSIHALHGESARVIQAHVTTCAECGSVLTDYEQLISLYAQQPNPLPPEPIRTRIFDRAAAAFGQRKTSPWFALAPRALSFATLGVIAAFMIILVNNQQNKPESTRQDLKEAETVIGSAITAEPMKAGSAQPSLVLSDAEPTPSVAVPMPSAPIESPPLLRYQPQFRFTEVSTGEGRNEEAALFERTAPMFDISEVASLGVQSLLDQAQGLSDRGEHQQSLAVYESAYNLNPNQPLKEAILYGWAYSLFKVDKKLLAREKLTLLEEMNPTFEGLLELKKQLER